MATTPNLDEFLKLAQPKRKQCPIGAAVEQLDKKAATQLQAACAADVGIINSGAIVQWLKNRSHVVSVSAVTTHRRGTCTCHG